ncbi:5-oxoprolinase subunit PxpB [Roseivirga sp. UBA1976]|jgi:inhibitor of KinA|uniref:5-oxoprolinase subunit PxpB n=1 Tax=Roseivirga sp. UBA1976 TaxID=1947386 RepID=UPI00257C42F8|nr:5-oxoprolinase subunit PxpB [Roseivirga sp. UBA1976]MEC7755874.1 5-oxoprolinase subunit PxpB [Bacteroidota bacterium]|tara:strand:+ start:2978 stop:3685 length:708 start_codon:yes stop_codon:yes gene_type:complete
MKIRPFGESALLVSLENTIDPVVNERIVRFYRKLKSSGEFTFLTPAYCSLTVGFDRTKFTIAQATEHVKTLCEHTDDLAETESRKITIPVCYSPSFAPDMEEVAKHTGLSSEKIIELHSQTTFRVFMLGFVAGFSYLGTLPNALHCPRKKTPRKSVAKGSVGLAGLQTGIYPVTAPGGWQIIGRTPLNMFDPARPQPNLVFAGDEVQFRPISPDEFKLIAIKVDTGIYETEIEYA